MPAYDYSQPIVINTYNSPTAQASADASPEQAVTQQQESTETTAAYQTFDAAREAFLKQDYQQALTLDEKSIGQTSGDPVMHEFGALCLFALGQYDQAAAVLNAVLAVAPGMDWATMSGLYGNVDTYTKQLRALEDYVERKPNDPSGHFVLAYHYLVTGHSDAAIEQLQTVVKLQPKDEVSRRMLEALQGEAKSEGTSQSAPLRPVPNRPRRLQQERPSRPQTWWAAGKRRKTAMCSSCRSTRTPSSSGRRFPRVAKR